MCIWCRCSRLLLRQICNLFDLIFRWRRPSDSGLAQRRASSDCHSYHSKRVSGIRIDSTKKSDAELWTMQSQKRLGEAKCYKTRLSSTRSLAFKEKCRTHSQAIKTSSIFDHSIPRERRPDAAMEDQVNAVRCRRQNHLGDSFLVFWC